MITVGIGSTTATRAALGDRGTTAVSLFGPLYISPKSTYTAESNIVVPEFLELSPFPKARWVVNDRDPGNFVVDAALLPSDPIEECSRSGQDPPTLFEGLRRLHEAVAEDKRRARNEVSKMIQTSEDPVVAADYALKTLLSFSPPDRIDEAIDVIGELPRQQINDFVETELQRTPLDEHGSSRNRRRGPSILRLK
jgi:hypothetical protein